VGGFGPWGGLVIEFVCLAEGSFEWWVWALGMEGGLAESTDMV